MLTTTKQTNNIMTEENKILLKMFLISAVKVMFTEGENDDMAKVMLELTDQGKMTYEEIFNIYKDIFN